MNPAKLRAITEWPKPKSVHDIKCSWDSPTSIVGSSRTSARLSLQLLPSSRKPANSIGTKQRRRSSNSSRQLSPLLLFYGTSTHPYLPSSKQMLPISHSVLSFLNETPTMDFFILSPSTAENSNWRSKIMKSTIRKCLQSFKRWITIDIISRG